MTIFPYLWSCIFIIGGFKEGGGWGIEGSALPCCWFSQKKVPPPPGWIKSWICFWVVYGFCAELWLFKICITLILKILSAIKMYCCFIKNENFYYMKITISEVNREMDRFSPLPRATSVILEPSLICNIVFPSQNHYTSYVLILNLNLMGYLHPYLWRSGGHFAPSPSFDLWKQ